MPTHSPTRYAARAAAMVLFSLSTVRQMDEYSTLGFVRKRQAGEGKGTLLLPRDGWMDGWVLGGMRRGGGDDEKMECKKMECKVSHS